MTTVQEVIWVLGGWSVILSAILLFIGNNLINRFKIGWEKNTQVTLNVLKGEIDLKNATITRLLTNHSNSSNLLAEKKLTCFDRYWSFIIQINELNYGTEFIYSYLLDNEIEQLLTDQGPAFQKIREADLNHVIQTYPGISTTVGKHKYEIDKLRPFIGEKLYHLYYTYSLFCMRSTFLLVGGMQKKQSKTWKRDSALINMLKIHISEPEFTNI